VEPSERAPDRVDDRRDRRVRGLVRGEQRDVPGERVAVGGGVDGNAADPLGELDGA
jgi:hypothetical protein